ncbi:MAG: hypothetical protein ACODAA_05835 [Gemmatimonadota bacterium]
MRKLPGPPVAWFGLVAALITAWLYRAFIFDPEVMLFGQEMIDQSWQLREFAMTEIEAGRGLPLWNPYLFGGLPYVAILPGPVFYPTTALYFVLPLFRAIGWTFVLHTFLAGLFAWFAARSLSLRRWPAAVTGLAFMLTGFFVSMNEAGHDGRMFTIALIPLAFAFLERGLQSRRIHWFLAMGLVVACQIFTPHVQLMYYSSLALSLYMLVRVIWMAREEGDWKPAGRVFGLYALGFLAAAAIGMAQLLPTLELRAFAVRGSTGLTGYDFASSWAVPAQEITALVLPDLIGSLETYWGANPFKQHTEYVGIVPAALAVIGLTTVRRDRRAGLIAGIAVLCVLFALGAATPVHRIAYEIVPMVREFRAASMMMGPAAFFVALLAGMGWQHVLDTRDARKPAGAGEEAGGGPHPGDLAWPWILALSAPVLLLGLAAALAPEGLVRWAQTSWYPSGWSRRLAADAVGALQANGWLLLGIWGSVLALAFGVARRRLPTEVVLAVLVLLVFDLTRVDERYISVTTPAEQFAPDALQAALHEEMDPLARVFPLEGYGPNAMMVHDIRSVAGMQNFRLEWTETLLGGLDYRNLGAPALWPVLDLEYLVTRQEIQTPLLERGPTGPRGTAWRIVDDFPHAWFPAAIEPQPTEGEAAVQRLAGRGSPTDFALVAAPGEARSAAGTSLPAAGRGSARVRSFTPNEIVLDVEAEAGGLLVVSKIFHPNWRAAVDGEEVPVWRADLALRGVEVPAGDHTVRFTYSARSVRRGLLLGGFALLACLAGIALGWRSTRSRSGRPESGVADGEGAAD